MSKTSSLYAEAWKNEQWEPTPEPKYFKGKRVPVCYMRPGTPYELYAVLVGYYHSSLDYYHWHTEKIALLSEPRGFPEDMNLIYKNYFERNMYDSKYTTWFLVQEVIDYDWDRTFPPCKGYVNSQYASLFGESAPIPDNFPKTEHIYKKQKDNTTEISWVETYREYVGCVDWFIEELLKLGDPKKVRIIFWLNY